MAPYQKLARPRVHRDRLIIQRSISIRAEESCLISAFSGDSLVSCFAEDGTTAKLTSVAAFLTLTELDTCPNRSSFRSDAPHCAKYS